MICRRIEPGCGSSPWSTPLSAVRAGHSSLIGAPKVNGSEITVGVRKGDIRRDGSEEPGNRAFRACSLLLCCLTLSLGRGGESACLEKAKGMEGVEEAGGSWDDRGNKYGASDNGWKRSSSMVDRNADFRFVAYAHFSGPRSLVKAE